MIATWLFIGTCAAALLIILTGVVCAITWAVQDLRHNTPTQKE